MDHHEQGQQPSLAVAISDSLRDVINGRISSFLQSLEASSDSPNVTKAMSSWAAAPSESEATRSMDDMDNDEILALTLEAEELAAVKAATIQETSTSASQVGAKPQSHAHKVCGNMSVLMDRANLV